MDSENNKALIGFTPTVPHCSMATLINLYIRACLLTNLPDHFKSEGVAKKELNDKKRVAAVLEIQ
ncbi:unnamed protein product [Rhizopus microsporus]